MGGYFSTRWGGERTRLDTAGLMKLDIRILRRQGALRPGTWSTQTWSRRGDPVGTINVRVALDGASLTLIYRTRQPGEEWQDVAETIDLVATPCNYGGERSWFLCPGCGTRRGVLFSVGGRFRCRQCHDLAYTSTREDAMDRATRRIWRLQEKLGYLDGDPWHIPSKPEGMTYRRYWRLIVQLREEIMERDALFDGELMAMVRRLSMLEERLDN